MIGTSKAWFCGNDGSVYELTGQGGSWFPSYGKNFTYTGEYVIVPEGDSGDWKVKFLTSGTFTATDALLIDVFAVGGGGVAVEFHMICMNMLVLLVVKVLVSV